MEGDQKVEFALTLFLDSREGAGLELGSKGTVSLLVKCKAML